MVYDYESRILDQGNIVPVSSLTNKETRILLEPLVLLKRTLFHSRISNNTVEIIIPLEINRQ